MVLSLWALALALVVALPGTCARRFGPWPVRACTLLVLGVIGVIALDSPVEEKVSEAPTLVLVAPGEQAAAVRAAVEARLGPTGWRLVPTAPRARDAAAALAVAGTEPRADLALLWVEPFADASAPIGHGVPVVLARTPLPFEIDLLRARALAPAREGRPLAVEVELPAGLEGVGELALGAGESGRVVQPIDARGAGTVRLDVEQPVAGEHVLELRLRAGEVAVEARGTLIVGERGVVVAVGPLAEPLVSALTAQGYRVESALAIPPSLEDVDVLIATARIPAADSARVREFVLDGGGLFLVGAPDGGALPIEGEDLASLSPVLLAARPTAAPSAGTGPGEASGPPPTGATPPVRPPEPAVGETDVAPPPVPGPPTEIERRSVAMVLVVDRSASMTEVVGGDGGLRRTRMDYVRSSAEATIRRLWPGDRLAIVSFGNPNSDVVVLPLSGVDDLGDAYRALAKLQASANEGTYLESALARAGTILEGVPAPVKHVVVITDGVIADLRPSSTLRAQRLREGGVTVSLIRFGAESADTLHFAVDCRRFAQLGGGQYVFSTRTTEVPALVSDEVRRVFAASGRVDPSLATVPSTEATAPGPKPAPELPPEVATGPPPPAPKPALLAVRAVAQSPLLLPLPERGLPSVAGVLAVAARPDAHALLVAGATGNPLLAFANRGIGRVGTFTSGLEAQWGGAWLAAPEFPSWFGRWIASLMPAQAAAAPGELWSERRVAPRGPTPRELVGLTTWSGRAPQVLQTLRRPDARPETRWRGTALALSIVAAASVLLLAVLEFLALRR